MKPKHFIPILIICLGMTGCVSMSNLANPFQPDDLDGLFSSIPAGTFETFDLYSAIPSAILNIHAYKGEDGQIWYDATLSVSAGVFTLTMKLKGLHGKPEVVEQQIRGLIKETKEEVGKRMAK